MDYKNKKIAITGFDGFIGRALSKKLTKLGANIDYLYGDVRDPKTFERVNHTVDLLFHFAAPSSQTLFNRKPEHCIDVTINGFKNALEAARSAGAKLIYPSTGILSQGATNEYSMAKHLCDQMALKSGVEMLGLRIFATYGPGELHKRDFASVPYLFAKDIVVGKNPIIFGDGSQKRDFIYVDDTVNAITRLALEQTGFVDVGSGQNHSFNQIIDEFREITGKDIKITYVGRPADYVDETKADIKKMQESYTPITDLQSGLARIIEEVGNA